MYLSAVSAQTVLLFQSTIVLGENAISVDGCVGDVNSKLALTAGVPSC